MRISIFQLFILKQTCSHKSFQLPNFQVRISNLLTIPSQNFQLGYNTKLEFLEVHSHKPLSNQILVLIGSKSFFQMILNWKITVSKNHSRLMFVFNFNPSIHDHVQAFHENRNYFHYKVFKRLHYNLISKNYIAHKKFYACKSSEGG